MRTALAALVCVLAPALAYAQAEAVRLPRNDIAISTGWIGTEYLDVGYNRWHARLFGGLSIGHYWTDNLKTDVEAGWLSTARAEIYEDLVIDGERTYGVSDYQFKNLKLSIGQSVQFGRNAWIHPYLAAGADIERLHISEDRAPQDRTIFISSRESHIVTIPGEHERDVSIRVRPFLKGGFKFYASDRAFFVQEFKFGLGSGIDHVLWKTGVGFDF